MSDPFEEKAAGWDQQAMVLQLSSAVGATLLERVPLSAGMRVMDFGAGTGLVSTHVAPHVAAIAAVDTSPSMLEKLVAKPELAGKVTAICQNILEAPLRQTFDLVVSAMALHHVEDTRRLLRVFADHLDAGGTVALADLDSEDGTFHPPDVEGVFHAGFDRDALGGLLADSGFVDVQFVTAHTVEKEDKTYPIFLVTAAKG